MMMGTALSCVSLVHSSQFVVLCWASEEVSAPSNSPIATNGIVVMVRVYSRTHHCQFFRNRNIRNNIIIIIVLFFENADIVA